jgi:hypothetical protein
MTTDPHNWFLTGQALDHHATVGALTNAMRPARMTHDQELAEIVATELARAGYALVPVDRTRSPETLRPGTPAHDLFLAMEKEQAKRNASGFLAREQD